MKSATLDPATRFRALPLGLDGVGPGSRAQALQSKRASLLELNSDRVIPVGIAGKLCKRRQNHTFVWLVGCCGSSHPRKVNANLKPHEFIAAAISWKSLPFVHTEAAGVFRYVSTLRSNLGRDGVVKTLRPVAGQK